MTTPTTASWGVAAYRDRLGKSDGNGKAEFPKRSFVMIVYISAMSIDLGRLMGKAGDQIEEALETNMGVENSNGFDAWRQVKRDN